MGPRPAGQTGCVPHRRYRFGACRVAQAAVAPAGSGRPGPL